MTSRKINVTLQDDVLNRVDSYCSSNGISRSSFISMSSVQFLNSVSLRPSIETLLYSMAAIADGTLKGDLTEAEAAERFSSVQSAYSNLLAEKHS